MTGKKISPDRKAIYYLGIALVVVGFLMFIGTMFSGMASFGDFTDFENRTRNMGMTALGGMVLMIVGGIVSSIGARGWAGSGIVLDPSQAREDIQPWSKMTGQVINDALEEVDALKGGAADAPAREVVKVRCRACESLNDETARFCNQCGKPM